MICDFQCPYCGEVYGDGELSHLYNFGNSHKIKCRRCSKKFYLYIEKVFNYNTKGDCDLNNEEHSWEEFRNNRKNGAWSKRCVKCGEISYE